MRYCKSCKVEVMTPAERCPLCGGELEPSAGGPEEAIYPPVAYSKSAVENIHALWFWIMGIFLFSIVVELLTSGSFWYLAATLGSMSVGGALLYSLKSRENLGFAILKLVIIVSSVATALDVLTGFTRWSVNFVVPFMVMGGALTLTLMLIIQPRWFRDYFVYQLTLCALCLLTLLLRFLGLTTVYWPTTAAAVGSVAAVATLFSFFGRRSLHEIHKRVHL